MNGYGKEAETRSSRAFVTAKIQWEMPHNERFANEPLVYEYEIGLDKIPDLISGGYRIGADGRSQR